MDVEKSDQAKEMIKAVYDDGLAEINGRQYRLTKMVHKKRRKVFAYYTKAAEQIKVGDFSFLDTEQWDAVEEVINSAVIFDGLQLNKIPDHWDKYPQDYMTFIATVLPVISYPFFAESGGD